MITAWMVGLALARDGATSQRRIAVVVDRSTSLLDTDHEDATSWRSAVGTLAEEHPGATFALLSFAASAEWAVEAWSPAAAIGDALSALPALSHGSECAYAVRLAAAREPAPTDIVVLTDGLARGCDVALEHGAPAVDVRVATAPVADSDDDALEEWLVARVHQAVLACVPKKRHRRQLPASFALQTTRRELVALDLGETDDRWRYCIAEAVTAVELDERFSGASLALQVPVATSDAIVTP